MERRIRLVHDNQKQELILLSVLPKHIAHEMKRDFEVGHDDEHTFRKIHIQKNENIRYFRNTG